MFKLKNKIFFDGYMLALDHLRHKKAEDGTMELRDWPGSVSNLIKKWHRELQKDAKDAFESHTEMVESRLTKFDPISDDLTDEEKKKEKARRKDIIEAEKKVLDTDKEFLAEIEALKEVENSYDLKPIIFDFTKWEAAGKFYDVSPAVLEVLDDIIEVR